MLISIVIPVFNEESTVGKVIERTKTALLKSKLTYEIIVVDDSSRDRSVQIAEHQGVKVYASKEHVGKGYALRMGFAKAKGEIIVTIDSDGSHRPEELPRLLNPILQNKADLVIGSRFLLEKGEAAARKLNRKGVNLFNLMVKFLTGIQTSDSQSGYRAIRTKYLHSLNLKSNEYEIESEMLVKAANNGLRVIEVPISFEARTYGKSALDPMKDGVKIFLSIVLAYLGR